MQSVSQRGIAGRTSTVQISILTHCYPFFITLQSPVEDQAATAKTRLFVLLQPNFCLLWPVFTPRFRFYSGRVSSMVGLHVAIFLHKIPFKQILYEILLKKIDITRKALLGLGPHREGTEWHRVSHRLFPFSTSMNHEQSFSCGTPDTRVKHLVSNSASSQEMRTTLHQHPSLTLMPLQQKLPWIYGTNFSSADLKSFSVYFMVIQPLYLFISHILDSIFIILSLRHQYGQQKRADTYFPTWTASICHSLGTHQTKPHFKILS